MAFPTACSPATSTSSGRDPSQGSELCTVVEYMFSLERALAITGDAAFGDRLEALAFNALPGTFTDDMWAHQYNQEPNQVECSLHHKPWTTDGPESNLFGLEPNFGCCTANFHQGWPKFAASLFLLSGDQDSNQNDGLVAAAYAPCEVRANIRGTAVHIVEETDYPFRGHVKITINPAAPLSRSRSNCASRHGRRVLLSPSTANRSRNRNAAPSPASNAPGNPAIASRSTFRCSPAFRAGSTTPSPSNAGRWSSPTASAKAG